jgi:hypothetical protein
VGKVKEILMSCFLIHWEDKFYANDELYINVVAGGERSFAKMLSRKIVAGKLLFDQILYPLTSQQEEACRQYGAVVQDFDAAYRQVNVLAQETVNRVKDHMEAGYPNAAVITIPGHLGLPLYTYRHATFFKVLDYKAHRKYAMVPKMAAIKLCGRLYVAVNAVNIRAETPIIVTVTE